MVITPDEAALEAQGVKIRWIHINVAVLPQAGRFQGLKIAEEV